MAEETIRGSLGELLLREGLITRSQLTTAHQVQLETERGLGRVLVEMGLITERVRMRLLSQNLGYEIVHIHTQRIDDALLTLVPRSVAVGHHLVPVRRDGDTLVIAMEDPTDVTVIDQLKATTGLTIQPVIAGVDEIEAILQGYPEGPEPVWIETRRFAPKRIIGDIILIILLVIPILAFLLYVPSNPGLLSRFARPGAYVDVFVFTLIGYGIYAVIVFEIWSLIFQRAAKESPVLPMPNRLQ